MKPGTLKVGDHVVECYDVGDREHRTAIVRRLVTRRGIRTGDIYVVWDDGASPRGAILSPSQLTREKEATS